MSRQTGDMEAIRHFVAYIIYQVYENILLFCFALFMIFTVNVKLALCMLIVLPLQPSPQQNSPKRFDRHSSASATAFLP